MQNNYTKQEMLDKVGTYEFLAEPFHCDFSNRLFMGHLGNHLLNAADFHSNDRNFGMNYLHTINKTWVLSRLAIEMEEMPLAYTRFSVETWVENALRFFTNRNFKVSDVKDGKVYGYGKSVWAMIDTETRQPADLFEINDGDIKNYILSDKECPMPQPEKDLERPSSTRLEARFLYYDLRVKTRSPSPLAWGPDFLRKRPRSLRSKDL